MGPKFVNFVVSYIFVDFILFFLVNYIGKEIVKDLQKTCLYPINVKTAEPIKSNIFKATHMTLERFMNVQKLKKIAFANL